MTSSFLKDFTVKYNVKSIIEFNVKTFPDLNKVKYTGYIRDKGLLDDFLLRNDNKNMEFKFADEKITEHAELVFVTFDDVNKFNYDIFDYSTKWVLIFSKNEFDNINTDSKWELYSKDNGIYIFKDKNKELYYTSLCLIIRDDHNYVKELIDYYILLGVDHFIINDHISKPPLKDLLKDYIDKGIMTYNYDERHKPQITFYNECIQKYNGVSKWLLFFDSDEFLVLKKHLNIKDFLVNYDDFGAVSISWLLFGSNGHETKQKSILNSYTKRSDENHQAHYKTIVQPKSVASFIIHHVKAHKGGYFTVDENKKHVSGPFPSKPSIELSQLNHYVLRSKEDYIDKQKRGGGNCNNFKDMNFFNVVDQNSTIEDNLILERINHMRNQ